MKKFLILLLLLPLIFSCDKDSGKRNVNPFIPDYSFSVSIDTNLPSYTPLTIPMNPVLVNIEGAGVNGVIIMKISDTDFRAWEANCPNQYPSDCSRMTISITSSNATCPCDGFTYNLITGVGDGQYTLKPYAVEVQGTVLRIYN